MVKAHYGKKPSWLMLKNPIVLWINILEHFELEDFVEFQQAFDLASTFPCTEV